MNFETISFNHGTHNERKQLMRSIPQGFSSTAGISKKLVTIFARHSDSFIMKPNLSVIYLIGDSGSRQFLEPGQIYRSPVPIAIGMQKLRHGVLPAGTSYWLKYRDRWPAGLRHQRFLLIPATVTGNSNPSKKVNSVLIL